MSVPLASPGLALRHFVEATRSPPSEPYRSLEPFRLADASILAAREGDVEQLVRVITMYRGVLLYGESGAGKTSLLNAGLLPRMMEDGFWPHRVRVQPPPASGLALEPIAAADRGDGAYLPSAFEGATENGQLVLAATDFAAAAAASAVAHGPILLVFDQFEELVTLFPRSPELSEAQTAIVDAIVALLRGGPEWSADEHRPMVRVKLVLAFREDYLASLKPLLDRYPDLIHQGLRLSAPPLSCATDIIRAPFKRFPGRYPRELSPELAGRIAASLAKDHEGEATPLSELQIVCDRLWRDSDPTALLDRRSIAGILEDHTEAALKRFPGRLREAAVAVLAQLITSSNTRNVVAGADLVLRVTEEQPDLDPQLLQQAIGMLETESGLIRRERRHDLDLFELTSEFLIPWISRQRDEVKAARMAEQARREQARRIHRLVLALGASLAILAVAVAAAVVFVHERNRARHERAVATDLALASRAQSLLGVRPDVSLLLALAAYRNGGRLAAVKTSMLAALEQTTLSGAFAILHGFTNAVTAVAFDPAANSNLLATGSADGTIRLWHTGPGQRRPAGEMLYAEHGAERATGGVFALAFSPDGRTLVSGGQRGAIRVWNVASRRQIAAPIPVAPGIVSSVAFSPDGDWLALAGLDAPIELIKLTGATSLGRPVTIRGSSDVRGIAFSPDSRTLVSVGNNNLIQPWNVETGTPDGSGRKAPVPLYSVTFKSGSDNQVAAGGQSGMVFLWDLNPAGQLESKPAVTLTVPRKPAIDSVAFTRHGATLAAGNFDDTIDLWNVKSGRYSRAGVLTGHDGTVTSVAFSTSGDVLASGSADRTIRLWHIPDRNNFGHALRPKLTKVKSIAFSDNGEFVAAGFDGGEGIWRWNVKNGVPYGNGTGLPGSGKVRSVSFSGDGTLASVGGDTATLWNVALTRSEHSWPGAKGDALYSVALSPAGRMLVYAGQLGRVTLVKSGSKPLVLHPRSLGVWSLAFGNDARVFASGGDDRTVRLWSATTGQQIRQLAGDSDAVFGLAFGPGDRMLVSGSGDGAVRLWNVAKGGEVGQPLLASQSAVKSVAFSPEGKIVASGSSDGAIRLWDVRDRQQIGDPFQSNRSSINSVAFSPNGRFLVSGGADGAVRIWPVVGPLSRYATLSAMVCGLVSTGLDPTERKEFVPGALYEDPCGRNDGGVP